MRLSLAPRLLPLLLTLGCSAAPFTQAAGAYAKVGTESSAALGAAPALLARSCVKAADAEYVQTRLTRLKFESEGIELPKGDYYVPWESWMEEKARPRSLKAGSWKDYCKEIEETGRAFSSAVGALGAYSAALEALVKGGSYEGTDIGKTVDGVNKIVVSVSASESSASRAVSAIGKALDKLAGVILSKRVEADIQAYVILADPEVQRLLVALRAYVVAVRADIEILHTGQLQVLVTFEKLTGLGEAATIAPCRVEAAIPAAAPVEKDAPAALIGAKKVDASKASPELAALRRDVEIQRKGLKEVCRSLDQLAKTTNAEKLLAFHALALSTDDDIRQTRAVLTGFEEVLSQLGAAHAGLVKAGQSHEKVELAPLLGIISDLTIRLGELQAALAQAKK